MEPCRDLCQVVAELIEGWLDANVRCGACALSPDQFQSHWNALWPEEQAHVARAVEKRKREFAAARVLARNNLESLGLDAMPLVPREDRSPVWPPQIVGSISHSLGYCVVLNAWRRDWKSLGVDIEERRPFAAGMAKMVLTPEELVAVGDLESCAAQEQCLLRFCIKEAFYKFQSPLTGLFLDFQDVTLTPVDAQRWSIAKSSGAQSRADLAFERLGFARWPVFAAWLDHSRVLAVAAQRADGDSAAAQG